MQPTAFDPKAWGDLYLAMAGASAALTGLLFVAVSINLDAIVKARSLPVRAAESLGMLIAILLLSTFVLIPEQGTTALGIELIGLGAALALADTALRRRVKRDRSQPVSHFILPLAMVILTALFVALAGTSVLLDAGIGLYWTVSALIFAYVGAVTNAWVLLVEIRR